MSSRILKYKKIREEKSHQKFQQGGVAFFADPSMYDKAKDPDYIRAEKVKEREFKDDIAAKKGDAARQAAAAKQQAAREKADFSNLKLLSSKMLDDKFAEGDGPAMLRNLVDKQIANNIIEYNQALSKNGPNYLISKDGIEHLQRTQASNSDLLGKWKTASAARNKVYSSYSDDDRRRLAVKDGRILSINPKTGKPEWVDDETYFLRKYDPKNEIDKEYAKNNIYQGMSVGDGINTYDNMGIDNPHHYEQLSGVQNGKQFLEKHITPVTKQVKSNSEDIFVNITTLSGGQTSQGDLINIKEVKEGIENLRAYGKIGTTGNLAALTNAANVSSREIMTSPAAVDYLKSVIYADGSRMKSILSNTKLDFDEAMAVEMQAMLLEYQYLGKFSKITKSMHNPKDSDGIRGPGDAIDTNTREFYAEGLENDSAIVIPTFKNVGKHADVLKAGDIDKVLRVGYPGRRLNTTATDVRGQMNAIDNNTANAKPATIANLPEDKREFLRIEEPTSLSGFDLRELGYDPTKAIFSDPTSLMGINMPVDGAGNILPEYHNMILDFNVEYKKQYEDLQKNKKSPGTGGNKLKLTPVTVESVLKTVVQNNPQYARMYQDWSMRTQNKAAGEIRTDRRMSSKVMFRISKDKYEATLNDPEFIKKHPELQVNTVYDYTSEEAAKFLKYTGDPNGTRNAVTNTMWEDYYVVEMPVIIDIEDYNNILKKHNLEGKAAYDSYKHQDINSIFGTIAADIKTEYGQSVK